jgi:ankyrin repeat protein
MSISTHEAQLSTHAAQLSTANQRSILVIAIQDKNIEIVKLLIAHGANVNQKIVTTHGTFTALYFAIITNHFDIVHMLLTNGASIDFGKYYGDFLCHHTTDVRILLLLIDYGFQFKLSIGNAIINCRYDIIRLVYFKGILKINDIVDNCCELIPPLIFCIQFRPEQLGMIRCLLECDANPNLTYDGENFFSPLSEAYLVKNKSLGREIIELLIIFGLYVDDDNDECELVYQIHFERYIKPLLSMVRKGLLTVVCLKLIVQNLPCTNMLLKLSRLFKMIDDDIYPGDKKDD